MVTRFCGTGSNPCVALPVQITLEGFDRPKLKMSAVRSARRENEGYGIADVQVNGRITGCHGGGVRAAGRFCRRWTCQSDRCASHDDSDSQSTGNFHLLPLSLCQLMGQELAVTIPARKGGIAVNRFCARDAGSRYPGSRPHVVSQLQLHRRSGPDNEAGAVRATWSERIGGRRIHRPHAVGVPYRSCRAQPTLRRGQRLAPAAYRCSARWGGFASSASLTTSGHTRSIWPMMNFRRDTQATNRRTCL